jgi:hypothetical protein
MMMYTEQGTSSAVTVAVGFAMMRQGLQPRADRSVLKTSFKTR